MASQVDLGNTGVGQNSYFFFLKNAIFVKFTVNPEPEARVSRPQLRQGAIRLLI